MQRLVRQYFALRHVGCRPAFAWRAAIAYVNRKPGQPSAFAAQPAFITTPDRKT